MAGRLPYNPTAPAMYAYWSVLARFTDPTPTLHPYVVSDVVMRALAEAFRRIDAELAARTARPPDRPRPVLVFRRPRGPSRRRP